MPERTVNTSPPAGGKTRDEIAQAYASPPWWYDVRGFFILTFSYNNSLWSQLRFFGPHFGTRHLEVACGTGTLLGLLLAWRKWKKLPLSEVCGIDYAPSMLAGALRRFANNPMVQLQHADAAALPYADGEFDTVNIANSVHCLPDVEGALKEMFRVLKPGGSLALNALLYPTGRWPLRQIAQRINRWGMRKGILYSPFNPEYIRERVTNQGFVVTTEQHLGNCLNLLVRKPG